MMNFNLPEDVKLILDTFHNHGYEAFIVGGCVRDFLLNTTPHDFDITTNALPDQVKEVFNNYHIIDTGLKHGTVTIRVNHTSYEVTTYRNDINYSDHRHPDKVLFSKDLSDDLKRRDFTINALAYNPEVGLVDQFDGIKDLENKIIRAVLVPEVRFEEDGLRILRALRFASRLNFTIEKATAQAIHTKKDLLKYISKERCFSELSQLLVTNDPTVILNNYRDVFGLLIKELVPMYDYDQKSRYHCYDLWKHSLEVVRNTENRLSLRLAALLHDTGKPASMSKDDKGYQHYINHGRYSAEITKKVLKDLKADNKLSDQVYKLVYYHDYQLALNKKSVRKLLSKIGPELYFDLIELKRADNKAHSQEYIKPKEYFDTLITLGKEIINNNECISLKQLAIKGNEVNQFGFSSKDTGLILNKILNKIMEEKLNNDKESIYRYLTQLAYNYHK